MQNNEVGPFPYTIEKTTSKWKNRPKYKSWHDKTLRKKKKHLGKIYNIGYSSGFLDITSKT